jgi:hypothetical protein
LKTSLVWGSPVATLTGCGELANCPVCQFATQTGELANSIFAITYRPKQISVASSPPITGELPRNDKVAN